MALETPLAEILRQTGRSRAWLARQLRIDPSSVSRWATGERSTPNHHLPRLADLLGVDEGMLRQGDHNLKESG